MDNETAETPEQLLARYDELFYLRDNLEAAKGEALRGIMAAVDADIAAVEEEFAPGLAVLDDEMSDLKLRLQDAALAAKQTIASDSRFQVVFRRGSKSCDWDKMDRIVTGLMKTHPTLASEIISCFSYGEPSASVQLRRRS